MLKLIKKSLKKNAEIDKIQLDIAELETNVTKQPGKSQIICGHGIKKRK